MATTRCLLVTLAATGMLGHLSNSSDAQAGEDAESAAAAELLLPPGARVGTTADQVARAIAKPARIGKQKLASNAEVGRGPALHVYGKVAPATVLISDSNGYGTGFLIDPDGWILTNQHVVADAPLQTGTGVQVVTVHLGHLQDRIMEVDEPGVIAFVHKSDVEKDLALLKLMKLPNSSARLATVAFAEEVPEPGSDCVAIGHPRAGMMWTVRSGEIAGVGLWPQDMIHAVTERLSAPAEDGEQLSRILQAVPKRKILLSTIGVNPGDSGGPLVDVDGKLIGVTFAIPQAREGERISVDKFSYHIHLDEVKAFAEDRPAEPMPFIPDPWPPAVVSSLVDRNRDKVLDTLMFAMAPEQACTGYLCDLDQDSSPDFDNGQLDNPWMRKMWDFEFAVQSLQFLRTFYDADNDGQIDVILTDADRDDVADLVLVFNDGQWVVVPKENQPMFAPSLFSDRQLAQRCAVFVGLAVPSVDDVSPAAPLPDIGN